MGEIEVIKSSLSARRLDAGKPSVVIHAEGGWLKSIREEKFDFFNKLVPLLTRQGISTRVVEAAGSAAKLLNGDNIVHIKVGAEPCYGANILHAAPSYIWGFWYLDEVGVHANSSLRFARFAPEGIDGEKAEYFFNGVTSYMKQENVSKVAQEDRVEGGLDHARAVVFCQDIENDRQRCHYLTTEEMIRTAGEHDRTARVYVKLHPDQSKPMRRSIMAICSDYPNVRLSSASVHDLIAASDIVVTQNSAAGFEALMHKRPVVTCAKSDFWHATLTARTVRDLREALEFGPQAMGDFAFEKYFYWFLDRNCLEPQKEEFAKRVWARIKDKAFL